MIDLVLRLIAESDADWYAANLDDEIIRWSREEAVEDTTSWWSSVNRSRLVIECCGDSVGSAKVSVSDHRIEISYWIARDHRRRGYASRALGIMTTEVADSRSGKPIELEIHPDNVGSIRTAERSGYRFHEMRVSCDSCADESGRVAVYRFRG
jgi:RimJ/RimL family protein N-acetyltransferase